MGWGGLSRPRPGRVVAADMMNVAPPLVQDQPALAVLLLVCAAPLHGDGIAGCDGSAHGRSVSVIRAGQPIPRKARSLREDGLRRHAIRVVVATTVSPMRFALRSAPRAAALRNQEYHERLSRPRKTAQSSSLSFRLAD